MKYIISYKRYGIDLNVQDSASREDLIRAYLEANNGPQGVLDAFLNRVSFIKDDTPEIEV